MFSELDAMDVRILNILQDDATTTISQIAEQVNSSNTVVWRRVQQLSDKGIIRARVALLDHRKMGLTVMVFASVKMSRHSRDVLPKFIEAIRRYPQVIECHTLMGNVDFLLKIVVPTVDDYEHFVWQKLSQIEGVQEVNSSISMSQPIYSTRLEPDLALSKM
jgi:Lrp/AsnC family transcriptional regulator